MAIRSASFVQEEVDDTPGGGGNNPTFRPVIPDRPPLPVAQQTNPDEQVAVIDIGAGA